MSDVVGMDGKPVAKARMSPEDVKEMRARQREDDAEQRRLVLLKLAVEIQNPSQVTAEATVRIAGTFHRFITQKETPREEGPASDPVPPLAPRTV